MRVLFFGTPDFAAVSLVSLLSSHHEVVGVISQPDRRRGRRGEPEPPPVAAVALGAGLPLAQPETARQDALRKWASALQPDVGVVVAYGHILPGSLLEVPPRGCLNVHGSLLPRWRGASPIQAAILAGDATTGVAILQMDEGLDTGDVLSEVEVPIEGTDTSESLHRKLASLGAAALVATLDQLEGGAISPRPQSPEGETYAPRLTKQDAALDFDHDAVSLHRRIRALHPWPGTRTLFRGDELLKVLPPVTMGGPAHGPPGTVIIASSKGIQVACGGGSSLVLHRLQAPGRRALDAGAFLAGHPLKAGDRLG